MNEIRDLIVGIDFGKEYSQICYYDRKGDEARSLSMKAGGNQYEAPCILCWRPEQKDYCVGLEADYFVREKGGVMIDDVYGICEKSDSVLVEGQELAPWEILAQFLQGMLKFLGVAELVKNTKCVAVTLPGLTEIQVENFQKAFEILSKSVTTSVLRAIQDTINITKIEMTEQEAIILWPKINAWVKETGEKPNIQSTNPIEQRLAQALLFIQDAKRKKMQNG